MNLSSMKYVSILVYFGFLNIGCGNKEAKPLPPVSGSKQPAADLIHGTANTCISKEKCDQLNIEFGGVSKLGGTVGSVLNWNISARTAGDLNRKVIIAFHEEKDKKAGMEIRSGALDPSLIVYWKPTEPVTGFVEVRARDFSRCEKLSANISQCQNMSVYLKDFDLISKYPFEVKPAGETFNAESSDFFKQFVCDGVASQTANAKKDDRDDRWKDIAVSIITAPIDAYTEDKDPSEALKEAAQKGIGNFIGGFINDFLNKDDKKKESTTTQTNKPTAYECLQKNTSTVK